MASIQPDDIAIAALAQAKKDEYDTKLALSAREKATAERAEEDSILNDKVHEGLIFPTDEEVATLRRIPDKIPWASYRKSRVIRRHHPVLRFQCQFIAFVEMAERFSYYGTVVVFTNFIQYPLPQGSHTGAGKHHQSGALNMHQRASTGLTTFNQFWVYVTPLFAAYIADTYWGRFKTINVAIAIALFGHILLIISAIPPVIVKPGASIGIFIISIIISGIGTGGFKSNISPLIAEQYKRTKMFVETRHNGEKVIIDPTLTASRIYMYFYLFINIGALVGQIGMVYAEKWVGFWLAFTLPTVVFCLCPLVMFIGRNRYIRTPPQGSVLSKALRIIRLCMKGRWSFNPLSLYRAINDPAFWEKAKPSKYISSEGTKPTWMTFDDQWVDEVSRGVKACKVFVWYPIYWLTYNQLNNNLTSQAATMNTHGLPNDVLSNLNPLSLIILIPICDLIIYPFLRRQGINFTPIKKITLGFFTGVAAMIWAAVVQHYVYKTSPCGYSAATCGDLTSPLNVWIQSGSYILIGISEIFASITGLEYAFTKAPKNMRSLVMSIFLFTNAFSAALGQAWVSLSEDPLLVWNYGSVAVIAFIAGIIFWFQFRSLDAQEEALNQLDVGHVIALHPTPPSPTVQETHCVASDSEKKKE